MIKKDEILKLIELKVQLINAEAIDKKERYESAKSGSYRYAEGFESDVMKEIERLEAEINKINL